MAAKICSVAAKSAAPAGASSSKSGPGWQGRVVASAFRARGDALSSVRGYLGVMLEKSALMPPSDAALVEWRVSGGLVPYEEAVAFMEARAEAIAARQAPELVWLLEHPPLYTGGTSARLVDLLEPRFPVHKSGRGGQFTYHGPGQRIAYVMLDLNRRNPDLRAFVHALESWLIATLAAFRITGERRCDRIGVWVRRPEKPRGPSREFAEDKIAAIGIRVRRWVSFHGIALNIAPDLSHFGGIVPCGIAAPHFGVTSFRDLGVAAGMGEVDAALRETFEGTFGDTLRV